MTSTSFNISGRVIHHESRRGIPNLRIEAWDKDHLFDDLVGSAVTDEQGQFQIAFTETYFRECFGDRRPDLFFKIFSQENQQIASTEDNVLWNINAGQTNITIEVNLPLPEEPQPNGETENQERFVVKGRITKADGNPLVNATVRAFDKDLRREQELGNPEQPAQTDNDGRYEITYTRDQFCRAEKKSADLIVRVFNSQRTIIVVSPIIFNAQPVEIVDLMVGGGEYKGLSEYEKLIEELRSLLGDQQLADLREDTEENPQSGKFRDISFLSGETGIKPELIQFLVLAARLGTRTDLHSAVFYGFFRQKLPTELPGLLTQSQEIQRRALETALHDNIIPGELKDRLEQILQRLQSLQIQQPEFLVKPEVLFSNLTDLSHLTEEESDFIIAKLNNRLRSEILNLASSVSEAMTNALQTAVTRINYQQVKDAELATVLKENVLSEIKKNKALAEEAIQIENRLAQNPSEKVSNLLYLDVPLKENPLFDAEVRLGKIFAYTKLAGLNDTVAKNLAVKNLSLDDLDDTVLADLVKEGILTDQQKNTLQLTADLGKLTGDNLPFVSTLKTRDLQSTANFINWDLADWQQLITNENIALPPRETTATYAETILFNIEKTYPSQVLFSRLLNSQLTTQFNLLDSVNILLRNNEKLIDGTNPASIDWRGVGAENREKLQADLQSLTTFANKYQHLGIADLINDKTVDLPQKKEIVNARLQSLDRFYKNNPNLDLRLVNFFDPQDSTLNWSNISTTDRPLVKKQLMAYQRSLNLAETVSDSQVLLSKGYDSAIAIVSKPEAEFIKTSGLELGKARLSYAKAQESTLAVSHNFETIRDAVWGRFKDIFVGNIDPGLVNDLREIDGFADLFGCQNYCDCEECKSILSPAAYFVDLMYFIEQHISKPVFINTNRTNHPLYLKNRRSDLWKLNLTCENTYTLIPYLTIVNEVLETYLNTVVSGDIFERLSHRSENISFGLPFNLPLEELRIYLGHFGIVLYEIYRTLKQPDTKIWRARLNLSQEEFAVITTPDLVGVKFRFGNPASFNDFDVQEFIRLAGINREQLDELRSLAFNPDLKAILVGNKSNPDDLQSCQEVIINLTENRLDFIHRFIRLWKKTAWSIPELDLVLTSLKEAGLIASDLNDTAVFSLAQLVDLQEKLKLTVEELCPMIHQLPVSKAFPIPPSKQGDRRLYERLFELKKIFREKDPNTHEINPTVTFHHYSLNTVNPSDKTIDPNTPLLLGGLGISETELLLLFNLLKNEMPFDDNGDCVLDRGRISLLYRHTRLARALKFSIEDFVQALHLNFAPANLVVTTLAQIHQLVKFRDWLKSSTFKVSELRFILKGEESNTMKYKVYLETVGKLVQENQKSQAANAITLKTVAAIIQEVQKSNPANKVEGLKNSLARVFALKVDELMTVLTLANIKIDEPAIQTALNATFTNDIPDNLSVLIPLFNYVREIDKAETTLKTVVGIIQEVQKSNPANKVEGLKNSLARVFALKADELMTVLTLANIKIDDPAIQTALNATFTNDIPDHPSVLIPLFNCVREIGKVESLKKILSKFLNLTSNQVADTLYWVNSNINSAEIQTALNTTFNNDIPDKPNDLNALLTLMKETERLLLLLGNLKFKEETIAYLTQKSAVLGIVSLKNLTLEYLKVLTFYKDMIALSDEAEPLVQMALDNYLAASSFSSDDTTKLADLWKQDKSLIESLTNSLNLPTVPIEALQYLWECLNLCQTLGINGFSLKKLTDEADFAQFSDPNKADEADFAKLSAARDVALGAFSSKYDDEKVRKEKLEPYQDRINVKKRDALCDYIIARQQDLKFKDLHDIYAFFLLDVEMSGCFRTSRLVCAISSLQLYVHRCLINLEQSDPKLNSNIVDIQVDPALIPAEEWDWRKNYRVWEANRKVFLYPENYIEPDLRDNKTPIFKELEDELLQQKITKESAESAYKKYISQFAELARLRIAGSYYHAPSKTYYFFGRTQQDPPQYYYRKWIDNKVWTPWEKLELAISSGQVSAIIHLGKLYLFWMSFKEKELTKFVSGSSRNDGYNYTLEINYSYLDEKAKWIAPQKLKWTELNYFVGDTDTGSQKLTLSPFIFPVIYENTIQLIYHDSDIWGDQAGARQLDLFKNQLLYPSYFGNLPRSIQISPSTSLLAISNDEGANNFSRQVRIEEFDAGQYTPEVKLNNFIVDNLIDNLPAGIALTTSFDIDIYQPEINIIGRKPGDFFFKIGEQQYLIQKNQFWFIGIDDLFLLGESFASAAVRSSPSFITQFSLTSRIASTSALSYAAIRHTFGRKRSMIRLSTSLPDKLGEILFNQGLEAFLNLNTQKLTEEQLPIKSLNLSELELPYTNPNHIDFKGAYGEYYRELFFHIPFLIANHLNANQKFKEAKWWYERIFDPTTSEPPNPAKPADRNWRYIEFRDMTLQKMKDTLTDQAAIEQYKKDPFNPHAIARLRLSAYQKAIVMKYIDNLLDWGDYLFAQDSMESINEATMLYVLAFDILGKRPAKLGQCETASDEKLTYENIGPAISKGSEFLITLENWSWSNSIAAVTSKMKTAIAVNAGLVSTTTSRSFPTNVEAVTRETVNPATTALSDRISMVELKPQYRVASYATAVQDKIRYVGTIKDWEVAPPIIKYPGFHFHIQTTPVFCVPPNYDLLKYWDRVEDRLFKIRNCMNISGVRRQLALFQPPIDPMALVRARAAGLSLEDILGMLNAPLPPYRFSYLIEKAKQYTQTVQSFGSALLSALEKKDVEELTLLRSVHERHIMRMTKDIKKQQVREAQYQYQAIVEAKANVQNRIDYYQGLIDAGLTGWEVTQQIAKHTATITQITSSVFYGSAPILFLLPQLGSPFAMKYGGKEMGDSAKAWGEFLNKIASIAEAVSASAGLEATFQRREQEWKHQLLLAQQELKPVEQQRLAADVRQLIAEKDLEIHEKNMEQADELHEFYKNKFTNLGLYNYLSTTLNRLYREAYNVAYDMAKMAERTYQFERDDDTIFIAGDNWQFDRAGLLAGERLLLQLQRMEKAYLEQHKRDYEITQSFSLALLNPSALVGLKQTGSCEFTIPEIMFDLFYPGQFKRLIKSVRITIPCVIGPYSNISAKLTLKESKVRKAATTDPADLIDVPSQKLTSIATSNAQNDGGLFELNFRDERYLPFEGAGAISTWGLELPSKLRPFSYDNISDVIIQISYIAKDDGAFRTNVENQIADALTDYAASSGLYRLLSFKHEFPNAFHQLLHPSGTTQTTEFELSKQHFPYFLADRELTLVSPVTVYLKSKDKDRLATTGLTLKVNNTNVSIWNDFAENLKAGTVSLSGNFIKKWTIYAEANSIDKDKLDDILILLKYTA